MEERWYALAISAHVNKSLDFSKITVYDSKSIFREKLVLQELYRERQLDFKRAKCLYSLVNATEEGSTIFGGWSEGEKNGYAKLLFPWDKEDSFTVGSNSKLRKILEGFK